MLILLLSSAALAQAAPPAPDTQAPASDEIVVTAKHDKCFMEYAKHQVSPQELAALSSSWALGAPVRVIEPRGASIKCEFQIMTLLSKHGQHLAQFVPRVEDRTDDPDDAAPAPAGPPSARPVAAPSTPPAPSRLAETSGLAAPVVRQRTIRSSARMSNDGARSGIVTLTCLMADPEKPYPLDVEVNEAKGTVTPSRPDTGGGSEMKATFMPDSVRFGPFQIDRTTLRIQRMNAPPTDTKSGGPTIVQGQCSLVQNLRRAF